ncbi:MAG TPA: hypothetical protein VGR26_17500 [Acidimicrobiales bacterium]|nr:hypothetical protein [Acidimicrobiales bacterium]
MRTSRREAGCAFQDIVELLDLPDLEVVEHQPDLVRAVWSAPRTTQGLVRMELRVGKGAGFGADLHLLGQA